jgi:fructose-specific phosphotransferase system IIC component
MTTAMLLLRAAFQVAAPMELVGDRLSAFIPVDPFLALMGAVGGYNQMKQLGVSSVIVGQILVGAIGGWVYAVAIGRNLVEPRQRALFSFVLYVLLPVVAFGAVLWPVLGTHGGGLRSWLRRSLRSSVSSSRSLLSNARSLPAMAG